MHQTVSNVVVSNGLVKFCAANQTDAAFPSKIPTTTKPASPGVVDFTGNGPSPNGTMAPQSLLILPYAVGSDTNTFLFRLTGWRLLGSATLTPIWIPTILCQFTCTISSTAAGLAGSPVVATEFFAATLAANAMNNLGTVFVSNALATPAHIICDIRGSQMVEATFNMNGSSTSANALYAAL